MSSSSKFTLARLFSIESSELIHKLSKDFSEDRTAAIFGNPTCLHRGKRKLFKKSAHEDYHFSTITFSKERSSKRLDHSYFWKPKLPPEKRSGKSFAAYSTSLAQCSPLSTSIFFSTICQPLDTWCIFTGPHPCKLLNIELTANSISRNTEEQNFFICHISNKVAQVVDHFEWKLALC